MTSLTFNKLELNIYSHEKAVLLYNSSAGVIRRLVPLLTILKGVHLVDLSGATINMRAEDDTPFFCQGQFVPYRIRTPSCPE